MPTKFQSERGVISPTPTAEAKFPIYFCEECGAPNAGFGRTRPDGRLSYCGWNGHQGICIGKGKAADGGQVPPPPAPW
jgi:hypothetical protein